MARKYQITEDTFALVDTEAKAYSLGFLLADAYVSTDRRTITLAVKRDDMAAVDYVRSCCGSTAPTFSKGRSSGYSGGDLICVGLSSKKLVSDLGALGVTPRKSVSTFLPEIRSDLKRHLIRGLFDGDGCIGGRQFWLVGSPSVLSSVVKAGEEIGVGLKIGNSNGYPRLFGGRKDRDFLDWLYADCEFALPRKLDRYLTDWKRPGALGPSILSSRSSR